MPAPPQPMICVAPSAITTSNDVTAAGAPTPGLTSATSYPLCSMTQIGWSPCSKGTLCCGSRPMVRSRTTLPNQHSTARCGKPNFGRWIEGLITASGDGSNSNSGWSCGIIGSVGEALVVRGAADLDDPLVGVIGVVALVVEQLGAILGGFAFGQCRVDAGDRRFCAVLVDELGPFDQGLDHL